MRLEIAELLPFYANGTLDAAERARVEAEISACAACAEELHQLEDLGAALRARAADAPPVSPRVLDDALARIAMPPAKAAATRIASAWWGTPARYATAATIVLSVGVAAAAAWHVHEAQTTSTSESSQVSTDVAPQRATTVYRVTPAPGAPRSAAPIGATLTQAKVDNAQSAPPPSVAKRHRLAKRARLELLVRDVDATLKRVASVVRGAGGDITSLDDANPRTKAAVHAATVDVEVPSERLDGTLDSLAALGAVQNRRIDAEDLDASIVDEEARLRNLRRAEADLRKLMDKGGKVDEILNVQQNLSDVRGQIEQLDAQHQHDLHRVATSTITVALTEDRPNPTSVKPGPSARIDGAWHAGLDALAEGVVAFISTVAWCVAFSPVPLALGAVAYAVMRIVRARTTPA